MVYLAALFLDMLSHLNELESNEQPHSLFSKQVFGKTGTSGKLTPHDEISRYVGMCVRLFVPSQRFRGEKASFGASR